MSSAIRHRFFLTRTAFIFDNVYALIFACFTVLVGCAVLAGGYALSRHHNFDRMRSSIFLTLFIFLSGVWVMCDSQLVLLTFGSTVKTVVLSFVIFMSMPISLLLYVRCLLSRRSRILDALCTLQMLNLFAMVTCFMMNLNKPYGTLVICHILLLCSIAAALTLCVLDGRHRGDRELMGVIRGFLALGICGIAALVQFYLVPNSHYAVLYSIGMMLFILFLSLANVQKLYMQVEKSIHAEAYQKMAYTDALTGLGNRLAMERRVRQLTSDVTYVFFDLNELKKSATSTVTQPVIPRSLPKPKASVKPFIRWANVTESAATSLLQFWKIPPSRMFHSQENV